MEFEYDQRTQELIGQLTGFMESHVYPAEAAHRDWVLDNPTSWDAPPVIEELKAEAQKRGLWNLFLPDKEHGAGLTNLQYAPLAEITGRSPALAPEATNCAAPDTGNMEVLAGFGTAQQQEQWLRPLLAGEIRSAFCMTEPDVASSDATNIATRIERDGDEYVINGHKWFTSNGSVADFLIVMAVTDPAAHPRRRASMFVVPAGTPGVDILRDVPTMSEPHEHPARHGGHTEIVYRDVRIPAENLIGNEGDGFLLAQQRLGPGRIHHCMRWLGQSGRAFDMLCERAQSRYAHGSLLADKQGIQWMIADSTMELYQAKLMVLHAAYRIDRGLDFASEVSMAKHFVANALGRIIDRSIQVHGALGYSTDTPLAHLYQHARWARLADGADEIHQMRIAQRTIAAYSREGSTRRATGDLPL